MRTDAQGLTLTTDSETAAEAFRQTVEGFAKYRRRHHAAARAGASPRRTSRWRTASRAIS
ncbi:MAG: hypothetical protein WDO24_29415 [Pseudomonadota bacterium]